MVSCIPQHYDVVTAATQRPVSVAECRLALRIDSVDEDSQIDEWIREAVEAVETDASICLMQQTLKLTLDDFPSLIELRRYPVQSVSSITTLDTAGATATLSASTYRVVSPSRGITRITPAYGLTWPTTTLVETGGVQVTFVAGYATVQAVPAIAKSAIKCRVGMFYREREGADAGDYEKAFNSFVSRLRMFNMV